MGQYWYDKSSFGFLKNVAALHMTAMKTRITHRKASNQDFGFYLDCRFEVAMECSEKLKQLVRFQYFNRIHPTLRFPGVNTLL